MCDTNTDEKRKHNKREWNQDPKDRCITGIDDEMVGHRVSSFDGLLDKTCHLTILLYTLIKSKSSIFKIKTTKSFDLVVFIFIRGWGISLFVCGFLLVDHSGEDLDEFNDRDDRKAERHSNEVFFPTDRNHAEYVSDGLNENDDGSEDEGKRACAPEPLVLTLDREDGAMERTHIERVEYFAHSECEERHSGTVNAVGDFKVTGFKPVRKP